MEPCIDPTAVTPEQLGEYAVDPTAAPPEVAQHIAACPSHQVELHQIQSFTRRLQGQLYRIDCPPSEDLTALAAGTLARKATATVEAHLLTCARCREELAMVTTALADHDPILDWNFAPAAENPVRRILAQWLDALSPGTVAGTPALNLRGTSSATRPTLYRAEDVTLSLRASPAAQNRVEIEGVLSSASDPTLTLAELPIRLYAVSIDAPPQLVVEERAEDGMFVLGPIPVGQYELEVHLPDRIIAVEDLHW